MTTQSSTAFKYYDEETVQESFLDEVIYGLSNRQKSLSPKYFYDEEGSILFDQICELPEYYPTRTEVNILRENITKISKYISDDCILIEPGSGSSNKVRILLEELQPSAYIPMDISKDYLREVAKDIATDFPWLDIHAACTDFTKTIDIPYSPADKQKVAFFPGSSIGNFEPEMAKQFLSNIAKLVLPGGGLLIGVDLKKETSILHSAYNDSQGITAQFNLNILKHINKELGADFNLNEFEHHAFYNKQQGRIEMHLVSSIKQKVTIGDCKITLEENESIHTENSYKYSKSEFSELAKSSGFSVADVWVDADELFSVYYLTA